MTTITKNYFSSAKMAPEILLITFITLLCILMKLKAKLQTNRVPPGPPKLPIIGNLHQLGNLPHRSLGTLSKKFGDFMFLQLGSMPAVVVSSPDRARDIYKNHDVAFAGRAPLYVIRKFSYDLSAVSAAPYGELWRELRKILTLELMTVRQVQSFRQIRAQEVSAMINGIVRSPGLIDLSSMVFLSSNNIVCRVAFGKTNPAGANENGRGYQEIFHDIQQLAGEFNVADYFPWLSWINRLDGTDRRLEEKWGEMDMFFNIVIGQHADPTRKKQEHEDIVDVLLRVQKDPDQTFNLTDEQIKGFLMDVFIAGTDTSAATIEWTMAELMRNPAARQKAQQEVRKVGQGKSTIEEDDLPKLTYLKQCIKESFRLHPPAPLLVPRETTEKCILDDKYELPAKTRVIINASAIGRHPKYWENPDEFLPERFMNSQVDFRGQHFELIPFGSGRRGCPGINFAVPVVELTLANLLFCFDWELPKGMSPKDIDLEEAVGITTHKKNHLRLVALLVNQGN